MAALAGTSEALRSLGVHAIQTSRAVHGLDTLDMDRGSSIWAQGDGRIEPLRARFDWEVEAGVGLHAEARLLHVLAYGARANHGGKVILRARRSAAGLTRGRRAQVLAVACEFLGSEATRHAHS